MANGGLGRYSYVGGEELGALVMDASYYDSMFETRKCTSCGMERVPDSKIVKKAGKRWMIYQCRICRMQDIEKAPPPIKIWKDGAFVEQEERES